MAHTHTRQVVSHIACDSYPHGPTEQRNQYELYCIFTAHNTRPTQPIDGENNDERTTNQADADEKVEKGGEDGTALARTENFL